MIIERYLTNKNNPVVGHPNKYRDLLTGEFLYRKDLEYRRLNNTIAKEVLRRIHEESLSYIIMGFNEDFVAIRSGYRIQKFGHMKSFIIPRAYWFDGVKSEFIIDMHTERIPQTWSGRGSTIFTWGKLYELISLIDDGGSYVTEYKVNKSTWVKKKKKYGKDYLEFFKSIYAKLQQANNLIYVREQTNDVVMHIEQLISRGRDLYKETKIYNYYDGDKRVIMGVMYDLYKQAGKNHNKIIELWEASPE